jgi:hypothetical protein
MASQDAHDAAPAQPGPTLRFRWERTWPDKERDFCCVGDHGDRVGRIYWSVGGISHQGMWLWFLNGTYQGRHLNLNGSEIEKMDAARALERAWVEVKARIDAPS